MAPSKKKLVGRGMQSELANGNLNLTDKNYSFGGTPIKGPLPMASSEVDMKFLGTFAVRLDRLPEFSELRFLIYVLRAYSLSF